MTQALAAEIESHLAAVARERALRAADAALAQRVDAVKRFQQQRFRRTYGDLLANPRYAGAAQFFLDELYGPGDFSQRDAEFARIVPALVRLFPQEVVQTVATLGELHALSERFDTAMGAALETTTGPLPSPDSYAAAWRACGDVAGRGRQVRLVRSVGEAIDALTRRPMLRRSLKLMRGPARAAGLGALQAFLESGFDCFHAMHGAQEFLSTVEHREMRIGAALFEGAERADEVLGQVP